MDDQHQQAAQNAPVEEQPQENSPTPEPKTDDAPAPQEPDEQPQESKSPAPEREGEPEEKRETRGSRRIHDLIDKLKEKDEGPVQPKPTDPVFPWETKGQKDNALFRPEDFEQGIDPVELQRRIEEQRIQDRELIKRELRAETEFRSAVKEHDADIAQTMKAPELDEKSDSYDRELDELVSEQYTASNQYIDPFTGEAKFSPRVKFSEIFEKQKRLLEKYRTSGQAQASAKLAESRDQAAVTPSGSGGSEIDYEAQALAERALTTGRDEDWAEVLKKRLFTNKK